MNLQWCQESALSLWPHVAWNNIPIKGLSKGVDDNHWLRLWMLKIVVTG